MAKFSVSYLARVVMNKLVQIVLLLSLLALAGCGGESKPLIVKRAELINVGFNGSNMAWGITQENNLLLTIDSGKKWETIEGDVVGGFDVVTFISEDTGWAFNSTGQGWQTTDGWKTWTCLSTLKEYGELSFCGGPRKLVFVDELHGWLAMILAVWTTDDGGVTWNMHSLFANSGRPLKEVLYIPRSFGFPSANVGWICDVKGGIYRTEDGGETWQERGSNLKEVDSEAVFFLDEFTCWVGCNSRGEIFRTDDGGYSWHKISEFDRQMRIETVQFISKTEGWVGGFKESVGNDPKSEPAFLHTTTGGKTWRLISFPETELIAYELHFTDPDYGWLLISNDWSGIYRTEDGGETWQNVLKIPNNPEVSYRFPPSE